MSFRLIFAGLFSEITPEAEPCPALTEARAEHGPFCILETRGPEKARRRFDFPNCLEHPRVGTIA